MSDVINGVFYSDPGHAWLRVRVEDFIKVGGEYTVYSHTSTTFVYLEEDCDAPTFIKAAKAAGYEVKTTEMGANSSSSIRRMSRLSSDYITFYLKRYESNNPPTMMIYS